MKPVPPVSRIIAADYSREIIIRDFLRASWIINDGSSRYFHIELTSILVDIAFSGYALINRYFLGNIAIPNQKSPRVDTKSDNLPIYICTIDFYNAPVDAPGIAHIR
jgi:hypothetical protein